MSFMDMSPDVGVLPQSLPIYSRQAAALTTEQLQFIEKVNRGDTGADINATMQQLTQMMAGVNRAITSSTSNLPIRENLEAEAKSLVPRDTPMRNRIPRVDGSGTAAKWRQITSYGGGYGASTTVASNAASAATSVALTSAAGLRVGDFVAIGSGATLEVKQISAISTNTITVTALANAQASGVAVVKVTFQPGGGAATQGFFSESGAPVDFTTAYASKTASYKIMGQLGSVTGFAMAAGANFQNQMAIEKTNAILNLMLNEENSLINGDSSATVAPWGDGTNALAFDGILPLTSTANGTPADQVSVSVGQLTTAHIDAQLTKLYYQGARGMYILMAGQEITSLAKIATGGSTNNYRIMLNPQAASLGTAVTGYLHPITGELVDIIPSRFISPGTILFGADYLPDGSAALQVDVLPQVQLPALAPNDNVQGYVAQEIAPAASSPQKYPFLVSVFQVLKMKGATVFAKSTGVTAA